MAEEAMATTNSVDEEMALPSQSPAEPSVESSNPSLLSEAPKRPRQDDNEGDGEEEEELRKKKQKVDVCTPPSSDALPAETLNGHAHETEAQKESEKEEDETTKEEVKEEKEEGNGVAAMDGESEVEAKEASPSSPSPPPAAAAEEEEVKGEEEEEEEEKSSISKPSEVTLGPKTFRSPSQLFHFVSELLHAWPLNFNVNKYERLVMTDLIQKGYPDPMAKIGAGIETFQVRMNPVYDSRCFYVMRKDGSMEDFSFRKCVDSLMGLPDDLRHHNGRNQHHGGKGGGKNQGYNKSGGKGRHGRGFNGRGHGRGRGGYRRG